MVWLLVLLSRQIVCREQMQTQRVSGMNFSDLVNINHCDLSTQSGLAPWCSLVRSQKQFIRGANDLLNSGVTGRAEFTGLRKKGSDTSGVTGTGF